MIYCNYGGKTDIKTHKKVNDFIYLHHINEKIKV